MTGLDLSTKAGVLRFCELRRAEMVGCFDQLGRWEVNGFAFGGYVFATHAIHALDDASNLEDWRTGPKLDRVTAEPCRLPAFLHGQIPRQLETTIFSKTVRAWAKISRAIGTVLMTETWRVYVPDGVARDELPADLEDAPNRKEALFMQLEHSATGRHVWSADIERHPTRVCPWSERVLGFRCRGGLESQRRRLRRARHRVPSRAAQAAQGGNMTSNRKGPSSDVGGTTSHGQSAERKLSVTITGPEGMLEAMAKLLREEGYTVAQTPIEALDMVLAEYLMAHPKAFPSKTSVLTLAEWLNERKAPPPKVRAKKRRGAKP